MSMLRIAELNAAYASAIDNDRLEEWPEFFVEDCLYKITSADNHRRGYAAGIVYADSRAMLRDRVTALRRANIYERQSYRHVIGLPLILLGATVPEWLGSGAETLVGLVIAALAVRVLLRWWRRDRPHAHDDRLRVLLLIAAIPDPVAACAALAAFAPLSAVSMAVCTSGFAWTLTRPSVQSFSDTFLLPMLGAGGLVFGGAYAGLI